MTTKELTIDAKGKSLGRVASEAATVLTGKDSADYAPNKVADVKVSIVNAGALSISDKKKTDKIYTRYTGYPSGLRKTKLSEVIDKKGYSEAIRKAIYGMLPANRLRAKIMKNVTVTQ